MATAVQMPKQGNSVTECLIVEWNVKVGESVQEGQTLCTIETDKASFEVPSPITGTLLKTLYNEGDLAPVLQDIAVVGEVGEDVSAFGGDNGSAAQPTTTEQPEAGAKVAVAADLPQEPSQPAAAAQRSGEAQAEAGADVRVSPRARQTADKFGIDPGTVLGSGPHGRVTSRDVEAAAEKARLTPHAAQVVTETGKVAGRGTGVGGRVRAEDLREAGVPEPVAEIAAAMPNLGAGATPTAIPHAGIRKLIADRMMASLAQHAQLTLHASASADAILAYRAKIKTATETMGLPNITLNDMIGYAVTRTLLKFPELNATFDRASGKHLRFGQVHLAFAVDTPRGLMVPVMRDAQAMSLAQLAQQSVRLAEQCRHGSIDPDLLAGGTFTISNLGAMGIEMFTPVLNSPQVAILGVCAIQPKAVPTKDGGVKWQQTMGLSLTIDHQVVDGAPAARFLKTLADGLANFELMLAE